MTRIGIASIDRRHLVPFLMAAVVLVLAVDMFTNTTGPVHDANAYVDIAENGLLGNENLVAPFAYRPALPLIVSALSKISSLPVMDSFRIVNRVCAVLVLFMTFVLADAISSRLHHVAIVGVVVALSFHNLKFPLFFYTLVDVGAFWVLLLAFWMLLQRWFGLCLLTCCVGVWFKEFLIVPAVLLMVALAREYRSGRSLYAGALIALGSVMMVASVVLPRVLLSTKASYQFFDPVGDPRGFSMLWSVPLNLKRDINLVLSWLSYWMPSLLLVTVARGRVVWERLEGWRLYLVMYVVLNVALAMYGGTNQRVFAAYSIAAQIVVLTVILAENVGFAEIAWVLVATFYHNQIFSRIPLPGHNLGEYLDALGFWSDRVNSVTWVRFGEIVLFLAIANVLRYAIRKYGDGSPYQRRSV